MKICWFGIYEKEYSRNKILIDGLKQQGVDIFECNAFNGGFFKYITLFRKLRSLQNNYDYIYCAYPIHFVIVIAYFFQTKPIIADAFIPAYDTIVNDRKIYSKFNPLSLLYLLVDLLTVKLPNAVIVDTEAHREFFTKWRNKQSIFVVPVGTHNAEFYPTTQIKQETSQFLVQFHGSYIPLQGTEKIIEAAKILQNVTNIQFRLIGEGQEYKKINSLVAKYQLQNIVFLPWLSIHELNIEINKADIILGIFGDSVKTDRVVANKLFQGLAVRKPVITKDTPAVRELFTSADLLMVENNPKELASAIMHLYSNKEVRDSLANNGYRKIEEKFLPRTIAAKLLAVLKNI